MNPFHKWDGNEKRFGGARFQEMIRIRLINEMFVKQFIAVRLQPTDDGIIKRLALAKLRKLILVAFLTPIMAIP